MWQSHIPNRPFSSSILRTKRRGLWLIKTCLFISVHWIETWVSCHGVLKPTWFYSINCIVHLRQVRLLPFLYHFSWNICIFYLLRHVCYLFLNLPLSLLYMYSFFCKSLSCLSFGRFSVDKWVVCWPIFWETRVQSQVESYQRLKNGTRCLLA